MSVQTFTVIRCDESDCHNQWYVEPGTRPQTARRYMRQAGWKSHQDPDVPGPLTDHCPLHSGATS